MPGHWVSHKELASILDVNQSTLTSWHRDQGMPIAIQGKRGAGYTYDTAAVFRWYGVWQVKKTLAKGHETAGKIVILKDEEARLKKFQADKAEIEAQKARREVILVEDAKDTLNDVAVVYGSQIDALGGRLANELAAIDEPAEIRQRLFAEGRRIREATADALEALVADTGGLVGEVGEGASATNG
jgi:phage terminase Nu1 subunit (DNA packaging protein)